MHFIKSKEFENYDIGKLVENNKNQHRNRIGIRLYTKSSIFGVQLEPSKYTDTDFTSKLTEHRENIEIDGLAHLVSNRELLTPRSPNTLCNRIPNQIRVCDFCRLSN